MTDQEYTFGEFPLEEKKKELDLGLKQRDCIVLDCFENNMIHILN